MSSEPEVLRGGVANAGAVVRVGDVVLRPSRASTPAAHALLRHVRAAGFEGVPEPMGIDPDGRERLRFIPGDIPMPPFPAWSLTDRALATTVALLRRFHDAQRGFVPLAGSEWCTDIADTEGGTVLCHNDVCPENVVFRDGVAVALLDFDFVAPGRPLYDLSQLAKMWVPLDAPEYAARMGRAGLDPFARLRVVADSYGLPPDRREFLEVIRASMEAVRDGGFVRQQVERGDPAFTAMWEEMGGAARYEQRWRWFEEHLERFADALE